MCCAALPTLVPIITLLMGTPVPGGGGEALNVKVTSKPLVPCGAEDGLTLAIWLVTAKAGAQNASSQTTSVAIKSLLFIRLILSVVAPHSNSTDPRQQQEMLPWNRQIDRHAQELLFQFGTLRPDFAAGAALSTRTRPAALHSRSALATLSAALTTHSWPTLATLSARPTLTAGTLRAVFVAREFAVAVLVQFLQRLAGLGDFVGVNDAVFVQVERFDDGIHRTLSAHAALTTRPTALSAGTTTGTTGPNFTVGRTLPFGALITVLRGDEARGSAQCQRKDDDFCFHDVFFVYCVFPAPAVGTDAVQQRVRLERRKSGRPARADVALKSELPPASRFSAASLRSGFILKDQSLAAPTPSAENCVRLRVPLARLRPFETMSSFLMPPA